MSVDPNVLKPPVAGLALNEHDALPAGTRFGEFEIIRALGAGGFGIVYLAQDHSLERQVALKEYMPAALAARGAGAMITIRSSSFAETYATGLRSFINEARLLARFDHPSLVKVYRFWEDNGTAYMVMPYLQGRTLRDARRSWGGPPTEAWIRGVLDPLLDALDLLHREGVFHRDVAPDNVLLPPEGAPILLDFGAARRVISDRTQTLTAILKPSYAPIEQYAEMVAMRQGPWTDIYALGAVLHFLLFGVPPAPATARAVQADAEEIGQRVVSGVSPRFLQVVAWMLGVRPLERPQNVAAVRAALDGSLEVPTVVRHDVTRPRVTPVPAATFASTRADAGLQPTERADAPTLVEHRGVETFAPTRRIAASEIAAIAASAVLPVSAPLRSTPPGTPPRAYVPPPRRGVAAIPLVAPAATPLAEVALASVAPRGRGRVLAGTMGALLVGAVVLWQFVGVIGRAHPARAAPVITSATPTPQSSSHEVPALGNVVGVPPQWSAGASAPAVAQLAVPMPVPASTRPPQVAALSSPVTPAAPAPVARRPRMAPSTVPEPPPRYVAAMPMTARDACGDRTFFSLAVCLDRQCERPRFRDEPGCVRILAAKRRRNGNY